MRDHRWRWLDDFIDKELGETPEDKKYYCFGIPVVYDTEKLKNEDK